MQKNVLILNGIKTKLIFSFMIVIAVLLLQTVYLSVVHFGIVAEYKEVTDNLVLENKFSYYVPEFIQSYYNLVNSPGNRERVKKYDQLRGDITAAFSRLDDSIVSADSRIAYRGLKNYVMKIVELCDEGIVHIESGKLVESTEVYEDVVNKARFINENSGNLIVKELSYAEEIQKRIEQTHITTINTVMTLIIITTLGCVTFSFIFAKRLTDPITDLSRTANRITKGDFKIKVSRNLTRRKDEIGTLSNSFNTMIKRLDEEIDAQKRISNDLEKSRKEIEARNFQMEKFNELAVGRELKMVELKKRIKDLEGKNGKGKK
ncbi:MAG: HAMP domain-containing protein [Candidatus Aenigmarchaeota archaeon]|nr:HAMP domain-containing protein [Candidatus Aenigmarchaeota archaeon]